MEERESIQKTAQESEGTGYAVQESEGTGYAVQGTAMEQKIQGMESAGEKAKGRNGKLIGAVIAGILILLAAGAVSVWYVMRPPKGCEDYTVQMQQYYVEYSDEYDYWDVLTIEYPEIAGIDSEKQDAVNIMMYDVAMDRSNYWHFNPDDEVKELQKEYSLFCSDVTCNVKYHSQYLLSMYYAEIYAPANPVWYISMTKRGLNIDLLTGEAYELADIIRIDEAFVDFWAKRANREYDDMFGDEEEDRQTLLAWFLKNDEEWNEYYDFQSYFYVTENKEIALGISINPKYLSAHEPQEDFYEICCDVQDLEAFMTESEFWKKYELSEPAGEIRQCEELQGNLWLGDIEGVWEYWEEKGDLLAH